MRVLEDVLMTKSVRTFWLSWVKTFDQKVTKFEKPGDSNENSLPRTVSRASVEREARR